MSTATCFIFSNVAREFARKIASSLSIKYVHSGRYQFPAVMCIPAVAHPHSRQGCAFPVMYIPFSGDDVHSRCRTSPFPARMCITGGLHRHFFVSRIPIPVFAFDKFRNKNFKASGGKGDELTSKHVHLD